MKARNPKHLRPATESAAAAATESATESAAESATESESAAESATATEPTHEPTPSHEPEPTPSHEPEPSRERELEPEAPEIEEARALPLLHLRGLLEALIFASDKPLTANELARLSSAPVKQVKDLLVEIRGAFTGRGIQLDEVAGGWLFRTHVQFAPFVRELTSGRPVKLTRAQIETLAIVAYRQPVTRPEIDDIRGVDSGATLKLLLERDLLRLLGKKDEPGRPLLYGTTTEFLEFFGLRSLKDLPTLREFTELSDESKRIAETELGGEGAPDPAPAPQANGEPVNGQTELDLTATASSEISADGATHPPPDPDTPRRAS
jgi:segregation and condensation protein B